MEIRCPQCNRFLCEADGYVRAVCPKCRVEVTAQRRPLDSRKSVHLM